MITFEHKVHYYETDKMGVVHHSNYIRWMEEARVFAMDQVGYPYKKFEDNGLVSPVLSVECAYKKSVFFGDVVGITVFLEKFHLATFSFGYKFYNISKNGELCATAKSSHCFINSSGKIINTEKDFSEFLKKLTEISQ